LFAVSAIRISFIIFAPARLVTPKECNSEVGLSTLKNLFTPNDRIINMAKREDL
jgi:hypothetical protein